MIDIALIFKALDEIRTRVKQALENQKDFQGIHERVKRVGEALKQLEAEGLPEDDAFAKNLEQFLQLLKDIGAYAKRFGDKHAIRKLMFARSHQKKVCRL